MIYPAAFLIELGSGIAALGLVYFLLYKFDASPAAVGIVAALRSLTYLAGCFFLRPFSRMMLPRYSLILSSGLCALFIILMLASDTLFFAAFWYSMVGFAFSLFWPPMMGWLYIGLEGRPLSSSIAKVNFSWSLGLIISPYIAGYLTERNRALPFAVAAALYLGVCLMVITASLVLHNVKSDRHLEPRKQKTKAKDYESTFLRFPSWTGSVSAFVVSGIVGVALPIYIHEALGLSERAVGFMLLTRGAAMTVGFYLLGKFGGWHFKKTPLIAVQLLIIAAVLILSQAAAPSLYYAFVPVLGLLISFAYSSGVFHGVSGSAERGKRMSINEALVTAGMVAGSTGGGYLYQRYSMGAVLYFAAAIAGATLIIQLSMLLCGQIRNTGGIPGDRPAG